jgi:hypothetical protein
MRSNIYTPQQRKILRLGVARRARHFYREHWIAEDQISGAREQLIETKLGVEAFRNMGLFATVLFLASQKINTDHRDTEGGLSSRNRALMNAARDLAHILRLHRERVKNLDDVSEWVEVVDETLGKPSVLSELVDDAKGQLASQETYAGAVSWSSYSHYLGHRVEYAAMAIIEMADAGKEYDGPDLPNEIDSTDPMALAAFAIHLNLVRKLPDQPISI